MPDGSHTAVHPTAEAREPSLTDALERLLACAGQGLPPDCVLRDIRALLSERGLLLNAGSDRDTVPTRCRPDAPSPPDTPATDARC